MCRARNTVLWATHLVEEAEAADRVVVLHQGRLLADGTPAAVTAGAGRRRLEEAFIRATQPSADTHNMLDHDWMNTPACPNPPSAPSALALSAPARAQGVAYVSSEKDHALTVIDLKTQAVTGTVPTCKRPRHMQLTPDGKQLAVACGESAQADFIDLATRKSARKVGLGDDPEIFDLSPDGKTLYVSHEEDAAGRRRPRQRQAHPQVKVGGSPKA